MLREEEKSTKQKILEGTFDFLIKNGLENATIRDICDHIGYSRGAVNRYYQHKKDLICAAAEYGLRRISDKVFTNFYNDASDVDNFFATCLNYIDEVKDELRFIYQVASSPVYGEMMHNSTFRFRHSYDDYARKLAEMSGGSFEDIQPIIYSFAATIVDYAIWQDREETQVQLNYLCKMLKKGMKQKVKGDTMAALDLFDNLQADVGCQYISDMRSGTYNELAKERMSKMDMHNIPLATLSDMAEYLYKEKVTFADYAEAESFFKLRIAG